MPADQTWTQPPRDLTLERGQVQVWLAQVRAEEHELDRSTELLCLPETARAARFHSPQHRDRYIFARAGLRRLLGGYLGCWPGAVKIEVAPSGKPFTEMRLNGLTLDFNISHSEDTILYGFALERALGIDLERVRLMPEMHAIAASYFSPAERAILGFASPEDALRLFYRFWTRKEAYLKALGEGLSERLPQIDSSVLAQPAHAMTLFQPCGEQDTRRFFLQDLSPAPDFSAALVTESRPTEVHLFHATFGG